MLEDSYNKSESDEDFFSNKEYFFDRSHLSNEPPSNVNKSTNQYDTNEHKNINQTNNSNNSNDSKVLLGNKRRPPKNEKHKKKERTKKPKKTRKYEKDEIFLKLQGHFITFIIKIVNLVLQSLNYDKSDRFTDIDSKFKKNIQKGFFESLKSKNLYYILKTRPSSRFTSKDSDYNKNLCEKLKDGEIIKNILNENYLNFFINVYHKNNRKFNLGNYGNTNMVIQISDEIKMYHDIETSDELYIKIMDNYVEKYILPKKLFKVEKMSN